jgi:hypothetical protein
LGFAKKMITESQNESLARQLRRLAWLHEKGDLPARYVNRLVDDTNYIFESLVRQQTLLKLAELFPGKSLWNKAGAVVDALERFEGAAWPRIRRGGRQPKTELDRLCTRILESGDAPCRRIVWEILRENQKLEIECAAAKDHC